VRIGKKGLIRAVRVRRRRDGWVRERRGWCGDIATLKRGIVVNGTKEGVVNVSACCTGLSQTKRMDDRIVFAAGCG